jgi:chromosome segregation ATPase
VGTKLVADKPTEQKNNFMSVNNKQWATFLLGAAAAFGAYKYMNMSDEEKEKMAASLKEKANNLKDQAVSAEDKAMEYFNELKSKGTDTFKEHMPKVEEFFNNLFSGGKSHAESTHSTASATTGAPGNTGLGENPASI